MWLRFKPRCVITEDTMDSRLILRAAMLVLGLVFVSGCAKVGEPWDKSDYFKEERMRSSEQQQFLQHRLAYFRDTSTDQPWAHAEH